jgi:hypothetical protein
VDNPLCSFEFDEELEEGVYKFSYERMYKLRDETDNFNSETVSALFTEDMNTLVADGRTTVFVKWDKDILEGFKRAADDYDQYFASRWVFVTFFHDDEDTRKLPASNPANGDSLDGKAEWLLAMAETPFIKKVEIPLDKVLTLDYIKELFQTYAVE